MDASRPAAPTATLQVQIPPMVAPGGGWLGMEEEMSPCRPNRRSPELVLESESPSFDRSAPPGFEKPYVREQQLIREAARRQCNEEESFFGGGRSQLEASSFSDEENPSFIRGCSKEPFNASRPPVTVNAISALQKVLQKVKRNEQYRTGIRSSTHLGVIVERSFVCPVENCGRKYKRQDHLNRHSLTHKGNLFPCTWEGCDLSFNVNANLRRHLKLHEKWGSTLRGWKKADAQLICPESGCGKTFKYPSLLQTHVDTVHDSLPISQAVCMEPGCGEIFESPSQLTIHTKAAHCFAFCETCGVSMLKTSLAAHARKHQGEQVVLRCPHPGCLHSYNKNSNLNTHIRAVHMDLKPYTCSHAGCELRFAYKSVRDKHEQCSIHSNFLLGGDFEAEDFQHRLKSRGGRKRLRLQNVDDLLPQKWRNHSLK